MDKLQLLRELTQAIKEVTDKLYKVSDLIRKAEYLEIDENNTEEQGIYFDYWFNRTIALGMAKILEEKMEKTITTVVIDH